MRITFLDSFSSERETFVAHKSYDVADDLARQLVRSKVAKPFTAEGAVEPKVEAKPVDEQPAKK